MANDQIQRLKSQLLKSGLQNKDQPLFQVINQLIDAVNDNTAAIIAATGSGGSGGSFAPGSASFVTVDVESGLPNSRQLRAGTGISLMNDGTHLYIICSIPIALDGEDGEMGPQGIQGIQGVPGPQGLQGIPGLDSECCCEPLLPVATTVITGAP